MRYQPIKVTLMLSMLSLALALPTFVLGQDGKTKPSGTPRLVMDSTEHDFGKVKEGDEPSYTFKVKNEGSTDLIIQNVSPACGCTASDFSKTVAPGQEGKITLSVKTVGMMGKVSRYADVISNDTQQPNLKLWLHLEVEKKAENN